MAQIPLMVILADPAYQMALEAVKKRHLEDLALTKGCAPSFGRWRPGMSPGDCKIQGF